MSKLIRAYPVFGSSINPDELSLRVKGYLLALVPIIMSLINAFGWPILETDVMKFIEAITILVSIGVIIKGWIRKKR